MKMNVTWKTGTPQTNGNYIVVYTWGYVTTIPFTVEYGWNTTGEGNNEYKIDGNDICAWTEDFGRHVIDIYGHRDIIKEKEGENGERLQHD